MNCDGCTACCNWLNYPCITRSQIEYHKARGATHIRGGLAWYYFPCPMVGPTGCSIHASKPLHCKSGLKPGDATCMLIRELEKIPAPPAPPPLHPKKE